MQKVWLMKLKIEGILIVFVLAQDNLNSHKGALSYDCSDEKQVYDSFKN